jgi:hypothetical protein
MGLPRVHPYRMITPKKGEAGPKILQVKISNPTPFRTQALAGSTAL